YDEARSILMKALDQDKGGWTAERVADLEYRLGHYKNATLWYRRAISEGKKDSLIYVSLAQAHAAMADWNATEMSYLDGIAEHPIDAFLYHKLGWWYETRGRSADAEKIYRKGGELPCVLSESSQSSARSSDVKLCYQLLANLLVDLGRQTERIK